MSSSQPSIQLLSFDNLQVCRKVRLTLADLIIGFRLGVGVRAARLLRARLHAHLQVSIEEHKKGDYRVLPLVTQGIGSNTSARAVAGELDAVEPRQVLDGLDVLYEFE